MSKFKLNFNIHKLQYYSYISTNGDKHVAYINNKKINIIGLLLCYMMFFNALILLHKTIKDLM